MHRHLFTAVALLLSAGAGSAEPPSTSASDTPLATGFPNIPADARRVAERLAACNHFAGEINGDGGERDKEVGVSMTGLGCATIEKDVAAIRRKYAADPTVEEALKQAEEQ
ncbi:hypothetical protein [Tahibacter harae]|uniref:Secreted protein n=1 Tax=Tahibacter harae TaxID=2963937 RepID=A0ABT1QX89_9GAMM|nr:hypothetical protein [Tahibacter harae]MCQ4166902.1 hypothetical protein [Tahibacter harae]